ncbi:MAG: DoxX family protein [Bacteroidota bacterium]
MSKRSKIIYWIATIWLALGMLSTGVVQLIQMEEEVEMILHLGYPASLMPLLGMWKVLGVIAVLLPGFLLLKEWAYAGFFFAMSGAIVSHIANGDATTTLFGPTLLLILTILSWYLRPLHRKITISEM